MSTLELLAKKHKDWINVVRSFGCSKETSEDLVQDMYIVIYNWAKKNNSSILYNDSEINYYFVYKVLRSLFYNIIKAKKNISENEIVEDLLKSNESDIEYVELLQDVNDKIEELHWYDKKIFEMVYKKNISMLQISDRTGISYNSIKRTIRKCKNQLKK